MYNPSHRPGSKSVYLPIQVRNTGDNTIRLQAKGVETSAFVSEALHAYLNGLKHTKPSLAGTGAMYVEAQATPHMEEIKGYSAPVRIQIKGPKLNRDWGAEFVVDCPEMHSHIGHPILATVIPPPGEPSIMASPLNKKLIKSIDDLVEDLLPEDEEDEEDD